MQNKFLFQSNLVIRNVDSYTELIFYTQICFSSTGPLDKVEIQVNYQYGTGEVKSRTETRVYALERKEGSLLQCYDLMEFFHGDGYLMETRKMRWEEGETRVRYMKFRKFAGAKESIFLDEFWITASLPTC